VKLEPLALWFQPAAGALLPQLRPFLLAASQARAGASARLLRGANTAPEPARGRRIEAVLVVGEPGAPGQHPTAGEGPMPSQASEDC
jgi:hypothetical protein